MPSVFTGASSVPDPVAFGPGNLAGPVRPWPSGVQRQTVTSKESPLSFASRAPVRTRAGTPGPLLESLPPRRNRICRARSE
ncbi:hypothetical protein AMK16_25160 [Streptomyces sp. CB00455]|nr:hypothetical protein AMK16_25160 [Streptomyces sp. CB00455]